MAIKFSLRFAIVLLLLHMIALMLVYVTAMSPGAGMAMLPILPSLIYFQARDVFLVLPDSWHEISLDQADVAIVTRRGSKLIGRIANETTVSPHFIVLRIKLEGHHLLRSRVIFPDAMDVGAFREMCVRLKYA